jgi:acyl-CoA thioester hydrolase
MLGLTPTLLRESGRGMVAVDQRIAYQREVVAGDVVSVRTGMLEVRDRVVRFVHEMRNVESDEVAAVTELTGVHLDTRTRKATALPDDVKARARGHVVSFAPPWQASARNGH